MGDKMTKILIQFLALLAICSAQAHSNDQSNEVTTKTREVLASLKCSATAFRVGARDKDNNGIIWTRVIREGGKISLEKYMGHLYVGGYYGVFNGNDNLELPYIRPTTYKNHYRFHNFDAVETAGSESGMWGQFILNKAVDTARSTENFSTDAHYVFQAGDHMGGTIDYTCVNDY